MITNYKFINYKKLLEETDKNDNIKIYLDKDKCEYIIQNNVNVNFETEDEYFENMENIWIYTEDFKKPTVLNNNYIVDFIFLFENNLIYKCTDEQDDWSENPEIQLYIHNKELHDKIYR